MKEIVTFLLLVTSVNCGLAAAEDHPGLQIETLLKTTTSWDGVAYKGYPARQPEVTVLKITIPAHTEMKWHEHPMPNAASVLSGELTVEKKETGEKRLLTAGQVLPEMVDALHRGGDWRFAGSVDCFLRGHAGDAALGSGKMTAPPSSKFRHG